MLEGKTIFLHIGMGKTGTTALQKTLFNERKKLLDLGYYYPEIGIQSRAHHALAQRGFEEVPENVKRLYGELIDSFNKQVADKMIISSESYCFLRPRYIQWVSEAFSGANVKVIFYARNQLELIPSTFLQWVKSGTRYEKNIESFIKKHKRAFDFEVRLASWVKYFGKETI